MSRTEIEITARDGKSLGTVATVTELVPVMRANPDATYVIRAIIEAPCGLHLSFEYDNCPVCGTSAVIA